MIICKLVSIRMKSVFQEEGILHMMLSSEHIIPHVADMIDAMSV